LCFICIGYNWEQSPPKRRGGAVVKHSEIGPNYLYAIVLS
jgi:hypothetical protein